MDPEILIWKGPSALSGFRRAALSRKIGALDVSSNHVHYVALKAGQQQRELSDSLKQFLDYGDAFEDVKSVSPEDSNAPKKAMNHDHLTTNTEEGARGSNHSHADNFKNAKASRPVGTEASKVTYYVSPRVGSISPWSSQATSIARVCGFSSRVRRIERGSVLMITVQGSPPTFPPPFADELYDRMTQILTAEPPDVNAMFAEHIPGVTRTIELQSPGVNAKQRLAKINSDLGLALDASEVDYLAQAYAPGGSLARDPFDAELFMFAQVNSEHCRHKQFNARWVIDRNEKSHSLFDMVRSTHKRNPGSVLSAYSDNAAVMKGPPGSYLAPNRSTNEWTQTKETVHYLAKVETHNHPTAVSPFPGAATGSGGEIRDEAAVGRGSKAKAGLCGFTVSDLLIPDFRQPWELDIGRPHHIASSLSIMLEAPLGSAAFNNEFGRPCTAGYFRTLLTRLPLGDGAHEYRGYHKPIMIAGGVGSVRPSLALKDPGDVSEGAFAIVLGGPAMLIGLGGGVASSVSAGSASAALDFASVQRGNAEVQRRAQEVINACAQGGAASPIRMIHDLGAGGLSNALPELVRDAGYGATFELREIDCADRGMSPMEIWCCEAQERFAALVAPEGLNTFKQIADRERCGYSVVGKTVGRGSGEKRLILMDRESAEFPKPIDLPMSILFGKPPKMTRVVDSRKLELPSFDASLSMYVPSTPKSGLLAEAVNRILCLPCVGSKSFLITIGDRTVGGLTARDQMVGPWQVPVADVSVTATSLTRGIKTGEAMAMGERPTLALISPAASARMAVAEALTNIAAADLANGLERLVMSANWMSASSHPGEGAAIYEAVEAITKELCPTLGISIPVGKDSMSMKMKWTDAQSKEAMEVTAPLSLVISAFAPVQNIHCTWTPALRRKEDVGESLLLFVDLAMGKKALGGSAVAQVFGQVGNAAPDVHDTLLLKDYFDAMGQLQEAGIVLAYHDRSDSGLFTTLVEMMFAGRCGIEVMLNEICNDANIPTVIETLFNEELGAVFQVRKEDEMEFTRAFATCGPPPGLIKKIGRVPSASKQELTIHHGPDLVYRNSRAALQQRWAATSHHMQRLRDNPACADAEHASLLEDADPGLSYHLTFDPKDTVAPPLSSLMNALSLAKRPRVAILREQGVNGQAEMAFGFMLAGFCAVDVHMTDLLAGRTHLSSFVGLAACGGFSYGDVLGAGRGWAQSVLLHQSLREQFRAFFERPDTFALGVCNGCQFLTHLRTLVPGAHAWPTFVRNASEQYEARASMVELLDDPAAPSVFLHGMAGSALPIAVAHGEGRASFERPHSAQALLERRGVALRYVDNKQRATEQYPANPNGSPLGVAGVRTPDGRVLAMMPHPERTVLAGVASWTPPGETEEWGELGPWARIFMSARRWVG